MAEKNDQKMRERAERAERIPAKLAGTACTGKKEKKYARVSGNQ